MVLGCDGDVSSHDAAATAGVIAERPGTALRVVVVRPERASTGWELDEGASFTAQVVHDNNDLVIVVPPPGSRSDDGQVTPEPAGARVDRPRLVGGEHDRTVC